MDGKLGGNTVEENEVKVKKLRRIDAAMVLLLLFSAFNVVTLIHITLLNKQHYTMKYETADDVKNQIQSLYNEKYIKGAYSTADAYNDSLKGFVAGTGDKYGRYLTPEEAKVFTDGENNSLTGIGVEVALATDTSNKTKVAIQEVYTGSPAEEAGIKVGDTIETVDTKDVSKMSLTNVVSSMQGLSGTQLGLTLLSNGVEKNIKLKREVIKTTDVVYKVINGDVGYIKIKQFTENTATAFKEALNTMKEKKINKFIFDVRDNGGGVVETAVSIIKTVANKGLIVKTVDKTGKTAEYDSESDGVDGQMIVLVNKNTASAAEMFTLALRDCGKAKVVGEKTYGKGTLLQAIPLNNGGILILSTGLYYTRTTPNIEGIGITPDVVVTQPSGNSDTQLDHALEMLK